jgi:hypothetical protein
MKALGTTRFSPGVEATAYFCAVALVDDLCQERACTVELDVIPLVAHLELRVHAFTRPSAELTGLVRDRAEAAGGTVELGPPVSVRIPTGGAAVAPAVSMESW